MKRRGVVGDPERVKAVRQVRLENQILPAMRAIKTTGEVQQRGAGSSWWERAGRALWRVREQMQKLLHEQSTKWRDYIRNKTPERRWTNIRTAQRPSPAGDKQR
jgi:hypothetical protein